MIFISLVGFFSVYSWLLRDQDESYLVMWAFKRYRPLLGEEYQKHSKAYYKSKSLCAGLEDRSVDWKQTLIVVEELWLQMVARRTWYPCAYNSKTEWGVWKSPWFSSCGTLTRETSHTRPDSEFYNCELINISFFFKVCGHCDITKENQDKQCELFFHLIKIGLE